MSVSVSGRRASEGLDVVNRLFPRVLLALGAPTFSTALHDVLNGIAPVDLYSAFLLPDDGAPRYLSAGGDAPGDPHFPRTASLRYANEFWHEDPTIATARTRPRQACRPGDALAVTRLSGGIIPASTYRRICYDGPGVLERLSFFDRIGNDRIMLNLYRRDRSGCFSDADLRSLMASIRPMMAATLKHAALEASGRLMPAIVAPDERALAVRLRRRHPQLSRREAEVCASLVIGRQIKEIAALGHLKQSSVVTYKKRAFVKLGATSRRELRTICMAVAAQGAAPPR